VAVEEVSNPVVCFIRQSKLSHLVRESYVAYSVECFGKIRSYNVAQTVVKFGFIIAVYRDFNIIDTLMEKLDNYANNLEKKILEQTRELEEERLRAELLLYSVMPP